MDSFEDNLGTVFHQICQNHSVPSFVKTANSRDIIPSLDNAALARVCADPIKLKYPCHTKAATWVSAAYFADDFGKLHPDYRRKVGDRITKFAEYHGISEDVKRIFDEKANLIKKASQVPVYPDDMYLSVTKQNGQIKRAGFLADAKSVETAADWLISNRDKLPLYKCSDIARKLYKRAAQLKMDPPHKDSLERLLGFGVNDNESIASLIEKRARMGMSGNRGLSQTMFQVAQEFRTNPPEIGSLTMMKAANFVDEFDHRAGLVACRERREIAYPEEIFYKHTINGMRKAASSSLKLQNGHIYDISAMDTLNRHAFQDTFGDDLTNECFTGHSLNKEAAARIFPTLPRPMADQLTAMLSKAGTRPFRTEKAAAVRIPQEFFK